MKHPVEQAAEVFGSQVAMAAALGVSKAAVNQWKLPGRKVPIEQCVAIEQMTGRIVRRWHLRPNDWFRIWPELQEVAGAPCVASLEGAH